MAECERQSGMHGQEDAYILEIADPESGRILAEGEKSNGEDSGSSLN